MKTMEKLMMAACLAACAGCSVHIDKPTEVAPGGRHGAVYAVGGDVHVAARGHIGAVRVVDGNVTLDEWATASAISTVSGAVVLGRQAVCERNLSTVDGPVRLGLGARVGGDVKTYVGSVETHDAQIAGSVRTVSGRITLTGITHVAGEIRLDRPDPSTDADDDARKRLPVVTIGPGVVVDGAIVALRGGTLRVSRRARIGRVQGMVPEWFDGKPSPVGAADNAP